MALKRINTLNRFRINEEIQQKGLRADEIIAVLGSADGVTSIVRGERQQVRKRSARPRRTAISAETTSATHEVLSANGKAKTVMLASAPSEDIWAYVTSDGAVLVTPPATRAPSSAPVKLAGSSSLVAVAATRSDQRLLVFTAEGQAVRATLSDQPIGRTLPVGRCCPCWAGTLSSPLSAGRTPPSTCWSQPAASSNAYRPRPSPTPTLRAPPGRVPEGDRVVVVVPHESDDEILIAKAGGQVLRIETGAKLRPVPTGGAGMVVGVKLDAGDRVVSAVRATGESLLNLHAFGLALAVPLDEYPVKGRGAGGVQSVLVDRPAKSPAGALALVVCQGPATKRTSSRTGAVCTTSTSGTTPWPAGDQFGPSCPWARRVPRGQVHWAAR